MLSAEPDRLSSEQSEGDSRMGRTRKATQKNATWPTQLATKTPESNSTSRFSE